MLPIAFTPMLHIMPDLMMGKLVGLGKEKSDDIIPVGYWLDNNIKERDVVVIIK